MSIPHFHAWIDRLGAQLPEDLQIQLHTRHSPLGHSDLPRRFEITDSFLKFLGLMLAEGHCTRDRCSIFAAHDDDVRTHFIVCAIDLELPVSIRKSSDVQISSNLWTRLLERLVGAKSRDKHLPEFWPRLSRRQLGVLLSAYMEGDGGVDGAMVTATTASRRLASDLGYAFLAFGIWARLHRRWKRATNSDHAGDWYETISISGQSGLRRFHSQIGFLTDRKRTRLATLLDRNENTNADVIPFPGAQLTALRSATDLTKGALSRASGMSRASLILM
jgi:replicative DNA helicase Mcm